MLCRLTLLLLFVAPPVAAAEPYSEAYRTELVQLLRVADDRGRQAQGVALRRYQAARALQNDGSADYAHGLVLLRLNKPKEALAAIGRAADATYLPAVRAHVALLLQQKQWTTAAVHLERFGNLLAEQPMRWDSREAAAEDATWLGRAVSTAQVIAPAPGDIERFNQADQRLRLTLTDPHRVAYVRGFEAVIQESEQLADVAAALRSAAREAQLAEADAARALLKTQQNQAEAERSNLKLTAEEWKKYLDEKLAELAQQLGTLEKQLNQLDQRRLSLERAIFLAQQEQQLLIARGQQLTSTQNSGSGGNRVQVNVNSSAVLAIDREINRVQQQLNQSQQEWNRVTADMTLAQQQALQALTQRQALIADYERATGKLVQQDETLRKLNERLTAKEKDLADGPRGKSASVQSVDQKRQSPATYLPMDWEAERQRWLNELGS